MAAATKSFNLMTALAFACFTFCLCAVGIGPAFNERGRGLVMASDLQFPDGDIRSIGARYIAFFLEKFFTPGT